MYYREEYDEPVSTKRVRQLRNAILIESRDPDFNPLGCMIWGLDSKKLFVRKNLTGNYCLERRIIAGA